jgi:hypothetical protein
MQWKAVMAAVVALLLSGCAPAAAPAVQTQAPPVETAAAYFAPEIGAALPDNDLNAHPEISVVHSMRELKAANAPQVWIDAEYLDDTDRDWLLSLNGVPVVVVGHGDGLYAFAERLRFPIEMPAGTHVDQYKKGYCVWTQMLDERGFGSQSIRSGEELTVQAILDTSAKLLPE